MDFADSVTDETFQLNSCGAAEVLSANRKVGGASPIFRQENPPESRTRFSRITHAHECLAE
jgi:hypothetical protein